MNDASRVGFREAVTGLDQKAGDLLWGQGAGAIQAARQILAFQVLHHHVRRAVFQRAHVEHARHVLALQAYGGAGFPQEASHVSLLLGQLVAEHLERDRMVQDQVLGLGDDANAPTPEEPLDAVLLVDHLTDADWAILLRHPARNVARSRHSRSRTR